MLITVPCQIKAVMSTQGELSHRVLWKDIRIEIHLPKACNRPIKAQLHKSSFPYYNPNFLDLLLTTKNVNEIRLQRHVALIITGNFSAAEKYTYTGNFYENIS